MNQERRKKIGRTIRKYNHKLTSAQVLAIGYLIVILIGSFLLALPWASRARVWTPYVDSLFTATSATCVTGLIVYDTATYWSTFGQIVILLLIQVGGIGFMTFVTLFSLFLRRHIGVFERKILMQSAGTMRIAGVVLLVRRILIGTLIVESVGVLLLCTRFIPIFGAGKGIYYAIFHSVSAFCNAGFDLLGGYGGEFTSLQSLSGDVVVNLTIMALIVIGGLGFLVWGNVFGEKFRFKRFNLQTKIVLVTTACLIVLPAIALFALERNYAFRDMNTGQAMMAALFQSITPRTAGFAGVDMTTMRDSSQFLTMGLMLVGGSPGSTAGGIKTTTFAVILLGLYAGARGTNRIIIGKRRLEDDVVRRANGLLTIYLTTICLATFLIATIDGTPLKETLFEVVSAIGTAGLSLNLTSSLGVCSKLIVIGLMFVGRLGAMSFALAFAEKRDNPPLDRPIERIMIG